MSKKQHIRIQSYTQHLQASKQLELTRLLDKSKDRREFERAIRNQPSHTLLASMKQEICGIISFLMESAGHEAQLLIFVEPKHRGMGIGTLLFEHGIKLLYHQYKNFNVSCLYPKGDLASESFLYKHGLAYRYTNLCMIYPHNKLLVDIAVRSEAQIIPYEDQYYEAMVRLRNIGILEDQAIKHMPQHELFLVNDSAYRDWMLLHKDEAFILLYEDQCAGFAMAGGDGEVRSIVVSPELRGLGFGKMLVTRALSHQLKRGKEEIYLWVAKNNTVARTMYQSLGFQIEAEYDCAYGTPIY